MGDNREPGEYRLDKCVISAVCVNTYLKDMSSIWNFMFSLVSSASDTVGWLAYGILTIKLDTNNNQTFPESAANLDNTTGLNGSRGVRIDRYHNNPSKI